MLTEKRFLLDNNYYITICKGYKTSDIGYTMNTFHIRVLWLVKLCCTQRNIIHI